MTSDKLLFLAVPFIFLLILTLAANPVGGVDAVSDEQVNEQPIDLYNAHSTASIIDIRVWGDGYIDDQFEVVKRHPGPPFIWDDESLNLSAEVVSGVVGAEYEVCQQTIDTEGNVVVEETCHTFTRTREPVQSVNMSIEEWPENASGMHMMQMTIGEGGETLYDRNELRINLIEKEGDISGDGLSNEREVSLGTDFTIVDTAGNGLTDWEEVERYGTDPLVGDTSGDGISDGTVVRLGLDPTEPYTVHKHIAGGLILFTSIVGLIVLTTLKILSVPIQSIGVIGIREENSGFDNSNPNENPGTASHDFSMDEGTNSDRLLTDEEYICRLIENSGGRMKQSQIVQESDWSKAKVSRILSRLEDEAVIDKLRIGRENLVELTNHQSSIVRETEPNDQAGPDT